ncbi:MAG TPA: hypothetical protein VND45_03945, partial [Thermoanaerobaculia bacterium]|nr:hypothetical protein [Thermoanaerobaculia bacterium]
MPRRVLTLVLFLFSFSSFAAEIAISDVRVVPGNSDSTRFAPSVVSSGDGFLVLWEQRVFAPGYPQKGAVRAYDAGGVPYSPAATHLAASVYSPRGVWTGTEYLIVAGTPFSRFGSYPTASLVVERVRPDGTLVDVPQPRHLNAQRPSAVLSLAWNGTHALAVVAGGDGQRHLLLLDREGRFVSDTVTTDDIVAAAPTSVAEFFLLRRDQGTAIAAGGDRFAVVNGESISILDRAANVLESFAIGRRMTSVAYDGTRWVTAYLDDASRVCTATFTGARDVQRSCRFTTNAAANPSAAGSRRRVFTAWEEPVAAQIMTDSGLASTAIAGQVVKDTAVDASGLLVVWQDGQRVIAGGLRPDGTRREQHVVAERGYDARVASAGDRSLVVWSDGVLRASVLDGTGRPVLPGIELGFGTYPRVAANDQGWVVVQDAESRVKATYVTRHGIVAGVQDFGDDEAYVPQYGPDIAAVSDGYVVVWMQRAEEGYEIISQKLTRFGLPLGARMVLGNAGTAYATGYDGTAIGCSGDRCLVVWRHELVTYVGRYVDRSGAPIGIEETFPSGEPRRQLPSVVIAPVGGQLRI